MPADSKTLHLGFIFYDFADSRAIDVIAGIMEQRGVDRISFFPAGPINGPAEVTENNRIKVLDALRNSSLDGLISLQFWESEEWFKTTLSDSLTCPIVPLLRSYSVAPGIVSPYSQGSYDAVRHLVEEHGCSKPYYLIGSAGNTINLDERFRGYRKALEDFGIPFSDDMKIAVKGSFSTGGLVSGALHQGGRAVDTLFVERGLIPGKDIDSLVVFNDRMAIEVMDALSKMNIRVPKDIRLISFDNTAEAETAKTPLTTSAIDWHTLGAEGVMLLRKIINGQQAEISLEIAPKLVIRNSCGCSNSIELLLHDNVRNLEFHAQRALFENITHDYNHTKDRLTAAANITRDSSILRNAALLLAKCNDLVSFSDTFTLLLNYLGLSECSIYLTDPYLDKHYSRHLHWSDHCRLYTFTEKSLNLKAFNPIIGKYPVSVVESLDQGDKHLGFLLFGASDSSFTSFGELRDLLSSIIYSLMLNENLKETQEQLIQKEKFSSLGRLVAGVAHEVNTPLGIGVTASSHLVTEVSDLKKKFADGALSKNFFLEALDAISESSQIIQKNLVRASSLINSFKNVSVNNMSDTVRRFVLKDEILDVVFMMKPVLKKNDLAIEIDCESDIELVCNPGILSQIISNLINNSFHHGYPEGQSGTIVISAAPYSVDELLLSYRDDGVGMTPAILEKVFEPFFTTRPNNGGTGLGMFIVFNMVTQKLNGRLKIDSTPGKGIVVDIFLPLPKKQTQSSQSSQSQLPPS